MEEQSNGEAEDRLDSEINCTQYVKGSLTFPVQEDNTRGKILLTNVNKPL